MPSLPLCRLLLIVCLLFAPVVLITGCGGEDGGSGSSPDDPVDTVDEARSPLDRNLSPGAGAAELEALAAGNADFAVDLLGMLGDRDRNLFFSPYGISLALTMLYAGAEGVTRGEMADALRYRLFGEDLHDAFNRLDLILEDRQTVPTPGSTPPPLLYIANALWAQKGRSFLSGYLDTLAIHYGAGVHRVDFEADPEAARRTINRWASDGTEGLIEEVLPTGTISSLTRLALTNAIYFQAHWEYPFDPDSTRDADFFLPDGGRTPVPMMTQKDRFAYAEGIDHQAVELPYVGEELSMVLLLPDADARPAFERGLTGRELLAICDDLTPELVRVYLPRFSMDPEAIRLDDALSGMGMETAFTEAADFSGMDGTRELAVSNATHKTFVSVDEFGTEAGAATAVVVGPTSGNPLYTLRADRPFLFLIRDMATRTILFMGRVTDPMENPLPH
jgi:serpin B